MKECFGDYGNWKCENCSLGEKCLQETVANKAISDADRDQQTEYKAIGIGEALIPSERVAEGGKMKVFQDEAVQDMYEVRKRETGNG